MKEIVKEFREILAPPMQFDNATICHIYFLNFLL